MDGDKRVLFCLRCIRRALEQSGTSVPEVEACVASLERVIRARERSFAVVDWHACKESFGRFADESVELHGDDLDMVVLCATLTAIGDGSAPDAIGDIADCAAGIADARGGDAALQRERRIQLIELAELSEFGNALIPAEMDEVLAVLCPEPA